MSGSTKGIVVFGFPRSGTTLVRRLLDAHPGIACPGETCILSASARFLHSETVADGLEFGVLNGLSFAGFEPDEIMRRLRNLAFTFHEEYAEKQGKRRWAEKTAVDVFHLPKIESLCSGNVQYVCIARHGLDVACSLQEFSDRGYTYLSEVHDYVARYPRPLEAFAHAWADANIALLDFIDRRSDDAILIRYEDLVASPEEQVRAMFDFLGEDVPDDLVEKAMQKPRSTGLGDWKTYGKSGIDRGSVKRWSSLPPFVTSRLADICNPTLRALGYESVKGRPRDEQSAARRRYEFSVLFGASSVKKDDG